VTARHATPEAAAIAADLMEEALAGLDETYVQVLHLRLQQYTEEEAATKLGCTRSFVRTKLEAKKVSGTVGLDRIR